MSFFFYLIFNEVGWLLMFALNHPAGEGEDSLCESSILSTVIKV